MSTCTYFAHMATSPAWDREDRIEPNKVHHAGDLAAMPSYSQHLAHHCITLLYLTTISTILSRLQKLTYFTNPHPRRDHKVLRQRPPPPSTCSKPCAKIRIHNTCIDHHHENYQDKLVARKSMIPPCEYVGESLDMTGSRTKVCEIP